MPAITKPTDPWHATESRRRSPKPSGPQPAACALHVAADYEAMSRAAADCIAAEVRQKPDALLCLATGASPARAYELLADKRRDEPHLFDRVRLMKLDEWGGLKPTDPGSCEAYLRQKLVEPLLVGTDRFFGWKCRPTNPRAECRRIADWLAANGPIDLCILGLGLNGHLGFNEPADVLAAGPHVAALSETSTTHSMLGEARGKVRHGFTLGMADLLHSRQVLLLVSGAAKAAPMRRLFTRQITTQFPASLLWLHPAFVIFADRAALSLIPKDALP